MPANINERRVLLESINNFKSTFVPFSFISEESLPEPAGAMSSLWIEIHDVVQCLGVLGPGHIRDVQVGIPRGQVVSDH